MVIAITMPQLMRQYKKTIQRISILTVSGPLAQQVEPERLWTSTGPLHTLITFTIYGNNVSGFFHFQPQGIQNGTGETTGRQVPEATGVTQESFTSFSSEWPGK